MTKAVAKKDDAANLPALAGMYEEEANQGFEGADQESYAIPFLSIVQSLSPQRDKKDGAYIEGAEEGNIFNSATEDLWDAEDGKEPLRVIPVHFKRSFVEWAPRDSGGGFITEHTVADGKDLLKSCTRNDKNQDVLPNGNYLVDTRTHYVLIVHDDGSAEPAVINMASTQMKKSRRWMTVMNNLKMKGSGGRLFTPPMYSHYYDLFTTQESNDKGRWHGWSFKNAGVVDNEEHFAAAKGFRDAIVQGSVKEQRDGGADGKASVEEEDF
jgi:hypothetical protein